MILSYGIPAAVIDAGQQTMPAATYDATDNASAMEAIAAAVAAEGGVFFFDGQGRPTFLDRQRQYTAANTVTFTDGSTSSTRIKYTPDMRAPSDIVRILNDVTVTRTDGVAQNAVDDASRSHFFRKSANYNLDLLTDEEALDRASYIVAKYKDARVRFDALSLMPQGDDNAWPHALGTDLGDLVTVERTPATTPSTLPSQTTVRECFVEGIEHRVAPGSWETNLQLSPAEWAQDAAFHLDASQLDAVNAVLAY
jgi:hypothetical protein